MRDQALYGQAPAMHVDFKPDQGDYDMVIVDWYCITDAPKTYWATNVIKRNSGGTDAYAGFQNIEVNNQNIHVTIFAVWNYNTDYVELEYVSPYVDRDTLLFTEFTDTGKHFICYYPWETGKWYTMCIGVRNYGGKTHYAQWVKEQESADWILLGIISFPQANRFIGSSNAFQEAFNRDNTEMKCKIKKIFGRRYGTTTWDSWNQLGVRNYFRQYDEPPTLESNVPIDCWCGINNSDNSFWVKAGGGSLVDETGIQFITYSLAAENPPSSTDIPQWSSLVPRCIRNKDNDQYLAALSNGTVTFLDNAYYWIFEETSDGYIKILNDNKTKALAITNTTAGSSLSLATISSSENQKWRRLSGEQTIASYISPKNAPQLDIGIYNDSVKLCSHSTTNDSQKWIVLNDGELKVLRSNISALYVTPVSGNIVQTLTQYKWNIVYTKRFNNPHEYLFSILTNDNKKAITLPDNAVAGTDLILADYVPGNAKQIWKKETAETAGSLKYYIRSKFNYDLAFDVQGQSTNPNTPIQVNTYSSGSNRLKWYFE